MNLLLQSIEKLSAVAKAGDGNDFDLLNAIAQEVKEQMKAPSPASGDVFLKAQAALSALGGIEHATVRVGTLLDIAQYFYVVGSPFKAIEPAKCALQLAEASFLKPLIRRSASILGAVYADTGNISSAIECYAHALDILKGLSDPDAECTVWINVGVSLIYAAQYRDAISCFEHAIEISTRTATPVLFRANANANIALCSLHLEDFALGLRAAELSIREVPEPKTASEMLSRVIRENNYARLLLEVNNLEKAAERCEISKRFATLSKSVRAEILASTVEGLCEVHSGRADVGISRLTATLEKARLLKSALREVLAALVKAYEVIGQPQRALIYLREMMENMRQVQLANSLEHLRMHLVDLGQEIEGQSTVASRLMRHEEALKGKVAEQELFTSRIEMLERLAVTAELRDDSTGEHSYRVGRLAALLAKEFGCDGDTCFMIEIAARLHDIGKIGVPDAILLKPDKLNDAERQIMRTHTTVGAELLSKSNIPHMQMAEEIARAHHEWWDGTGYPGSMAGKAIPLAARITALADVFDALTHKRPYKQPWPIDLALQEIAGLKGTQFEPELTDLFLVMIGRLRTEHADIDSFLAQAAHASPFLQARSRIWDTLRKSKEGNSTVSGSRLDLQR